VKTCERYHSIQGRLSLELDAPRRDDRECSTGGWEINEAGAGPPMSLRHELRHRAALNKGI
jgi:hypothetical protein